MATLDQILLRLPRKAPDADFMDRLFGQIRGTGAFTPATDPDPFLFEPEWIEPAQLNVQEEVEVTQTDANLYRSPVTEKESSSDINRFTQFSP